MPRLTTLALINPRLTALLLGALTALGFEPLELWPLALLALAGLIVLLRAAPGRKAAFQLGWCFGLGQFALALNWVEPLSLITPTCRCGWAGSRWC